ncbi:invasion associated locus B family protein [Xanthobacter autotrophicus DSM 431]|uniref:invasion associated locus B family protein n=1 Tax=Xanthobacter nonsaccharivorans TaxID=3119912 RepID=UPI0037262298
MTPIQTVKTSIVGLSLLLAGAVAVPLLSGYATVAEAQQAPQQATRTAQAAAPAGPVKTETTSFDNWILTCQEVPPAAGAKTGRKTCWAVMRVTEAKSSQVVLVLKLGRDGKDVPTLAVTTPTGVFVRDGLDLTLGQSTRKLAYQWCGPKECEASAAYDQAFANDLAANKEATLSFRIQDGRQVNVKVALNGVDKVLASLKKS